MGTANGSASGRQTPARLLTASSIKSHVASQISCTCDVRGSVQEQFVSASRGDNTRCMHAPDGQSRAASSRVGGKSSTASALPWLGYLPALVGMSEVRDEPCSGTGRSRGRAALRSVKSGRTLPCCAFQRPRRSLVHRAVSDETGPRDSVQRRPTQRGLAMHSRRTRIAASDSWLIRQRTDTRCCVGCTNASLPSCFWMIFAQHFRISGATS